MTPDEKDNGKLPEHVVAPRVKTGDCMPNINMPEEVADDLRAYIFELINTKQWAGRSDRSIAGEIINEDKEGTDEPRFYTLEDGEPKRLKLETLRMLLKTYRHRSLEVFKEDLMPYIQEAIVEVIKTAGSKPANLKMILDALQLGKKESEDNGHKEDTPSPAYAKISEKLGHGRKRLEGDVPKRTSSVTTGLGLLGYEDTVRDDPGKRRRPATGVVPGRDDPGMDEPPNIIEVDRGSDAPPSFTSEDYVLDYGGEYLVDTEEPEHSDTDELGGTEVDEKGDGDDQTALHEQ